MTELQKKLDAALTQLYTVQPNYQKPKFEVGETVYKIRYFGTPRQGYDLQIIAYTIKYVGKGVFLPTNYQTLSNPEISFSDCYTSFEDAMAELRRRNHTDGIEFSFDKARTFCTVYVNKGGA